jgi:hypothetical protein
VICRDRRRAVAGTLSSIHLNAISFCGSRTVECDAACFGALGYNDSSIVLEARDLWAHKALVRLDNLP